MLQVALDHALDVEVGIERARDLFQIEQGLAQQAHLGRRAQAAGGGDAHQLDHQPAFGQRLRTGMRGVARHQLADLAQVAFLVEVFQPRAHRDRFVGDLLAAAVDRGEQQLEQALALLRRHVRDHAEVEQRQPPVVGDQQVARMRIGVDLAVHEHLVEVAAHQRRAQLAEVLLGAAQAGQVGDLLAMDQLHRQHLAGAQVPHRRRHEQLRDSRRNGR